MVTYLTKSDASEGFNQIINFLNGSYIQYALTVNPNIYVSCIKQFWNTVAIKQVNDVTRLQALVDKKKVVVTEAAIREVFRLDDVEGVDCLPNEEIFAELARMGDDIATYGEVPTVSQEPFIPSPTPPTPPPQPPQDLPSTSQHFNACAALARRVEHLENDKVAQALEITKLKRRVKKLEKGNRVKVLKLRRIIDKLDKDDAIALMDDKEEDKKEEDAKVVEDDQEDEPAEVQDVVDVVTTAKKRKGVVIKDPEENLTTSSIMPADTKSKDKGKGIMVEEPKPLKKKKQIEIDEEYARKLHAELNKNIDWDAAIDHATPLARKVPIVDYEIITLNNKPYYKIIRADGTHQLFISFMTLLKNFDREDLEALWSLVKERFSTSKPKNFTDDFLMTTLGAMFEKPDGQAQVWKNQRSIHGQAKVKSWKLLELCELSAAKQKLMLLDCAAERSLMLLSQVKTANDK
nr:hypothetical protein [Tanacetum cinerariifolium]